MADGITSGIEINLPLSNRANKSLLPRDEPVIFLLLQFVTSIRYRVFSHDVTTAILVSQNNETAAMLVSQTSPLGVELFSYPNAFFCYNKFAYMLAT